MFNKVAPFSENITALARARDLAAGKLDPDLEGQIDQLLAHLTERSQLGLDATVVAFAGGTGAGKSSLFNLVNDVDIARVSAIRPTTSEALALTNHDAPTLLDWLGISQRHILRDLPLRYGLDRANDADFIVLDLPDIDSTNQTNREIAANLAQRVDVLIWVLDPQKYADAVLFEDFLQKMIEHSKTTIVVLNQVDTLDDIAREQVLSDVRRLLAKHDITAEVIPASAKTGQGVAQIRAQIKSVAAQTSAARDRLSADIRTLATKLDEFSLNSARNNALESNRLGQITTEAELNGIVTALWRALGLDELTASAAQSHLYRGRKHTSWLLTRWWLTRRRDPLAKFRLPSAGFGRTNERRADKAAAKSKTEPVAEFAAAGLDQHNELARVEQGDATLRVPSLIKDQKSLAEVENETQRLVQYQAAALPRRWRDYLLALTQGSAENMLTHAAQIMDRVQLRRRNPLWWQLMNLLQWLSTLTFIVGVGWLILWNFGDNFGLFLPEPPTYGIFSLPLLLLIGGLLCGWLFALVSEPLLHRGAKSVKRKAQQQLQKQLGEIAQHEIGTKLNAELANYAEYDEILQKLKSAR